jgi:hypothetical protein
MGGSKNGCSVSWPYATASRCTEGDEILSLGNVFGMLELLSLSHMEFQIFLINLKGPFMHGGRQLFSPILLVEVEGSLLK